MKGKWTRCMNVINGLNYTRSLHYKEEVDQRGMSPKIGDAGVKVVYNSTSGTLMVVFTNTSYIATLVV